MALFDQILAQQQAVFKGEVLAGLSQMARIGGNVADKIAANIRVEEHLPTDVFLSFLAELKETSFDRQDWEEDFNRLCERYELQGEEITAYRPTLLGRVVSRESFFEYVQDMNNISEFQVKVFQKLPLEDQKRLLALVNLSRTRRVVFATFDPKQRNRDPFQLLRNDPNRVRNALGLGYLLAGTVLVALLYSLPLSRPLHFPTVCDAGWTEYFRPSGKNEPHGWTQPLARKWFSRIAASGFICRIITRPKSRISKVVNWLTSGEEPKPEVAHENVSASVINQPIRVL